MTAQFELAGGSMIGRNHRLMSKNNQDSWSVWQNEIVTVGIVADGCGSGTHSEVGARLGSQLLGRYIYESYRQCSTVNWDAAKAFALWELGRSAAAMGSDHRTWVENHLLFTVLGVVITDDETVFFGCGDGMIVVNGKRMPLGPFAGNMPPYIGYGLLADEIGFDAAMHAFGPLLRLPAAELSSFLIATDGIDDLIANAQNVLPGMNRLVGEIDDFWLNDRYFRGNPELVSRQLKLVGRDWPTTDPCPGLLGDDTTLIAGRRRT